jgi:hypothetical protein
MSHKYFYSSRARVAANISASRALSYLAMPVLREKARTNQFRSINSAKAHTFRCSSAGLAPPQVKKMPFHGSGKPAGASLARGGW